MTHFRFVTHFRFMAHHGSMTHFRYDSLLVTGWLGIPEMRSVHQNQGRVVDAARLQKVMLEKSRRLLGDDHPNTLSTMNYVVSTYNSRGRMAEAGRIHDEMLEKTRWILGNDHLDTLMTMSNLAETQRVQGGQRRRFGSRSRRWIRSGGSSATTIPAR